MRLVLTTLFAMLAFAGNSLLCRVALKGLGIDQGRPGGGMLRHLAYHG